MGESLLHSGALEFKLDDGPWGNRLLEVFEGRLQWRESEDAAVEAEVSLSKSSSVRRLKFGLKKFMFEVETDGVLVTLAAAGSAEQLDWIQAIESARHDEESEGGTRSRKPVARSKSLVEGERKVKEQQAKSASKSSLESIVNGSKKKNALQEKLDGKVSFNVETPLCDVCNEDLLALQAVKVEGRRMHKKCFVCCTCKTKLLPGTYAAIGDAIYCRKHYLAELRGNKKKKKKPESSFSKMVNEVIAKKEETQLSKSEGMLKKLSRRLSQRITKGVTSLEEKDEKDSQKAKEEEIEKQERQLERQTLVQKMIAETRFDSDSDYNDVEDGNDDAFEEEEEEVKIKKESRGKKGSKPKRSDQFDEEEGAEKKERKTAPSHKVEETPVENRESRKTGHIEESPRKSKEESAIHKKFGALTGALDRKFSHMPPAAARPESVDSSFSSARRKSRRSVVDENDEKQESPELEHTAMLRPVIAGPRRRRPPPKQEEADLLPASSDKEKFTHGLTFKFDGGNGTLLQFHCNSATERNQWIQRMSSAVHLEQVRCKLHEAQKQDMMKSLQAKAELENFMKTGDFQYEGYMEVVTEKKKKRKWKKKFVVLINQKILICSSRKKKRKPQTTIDISANSSVLDIRNRILRPKL